MFSSIVSSLLTAAVLFQSVAAQGCTAITPKFAPKVASGYTASVILNGLSSPRGMIFDSVGNLLIVEQGGKGIRIAKMTADGCVASSKQLIDDRSVSLDHLQAVFRKAHNIQLNHGIQLTTDEKWLFVSSTTTVYVYPYDVAAGTVGAKKTVM